MDLMLIEKITVTKFDLGDRVIYVKIVWEENENIMFQMKVFDDVNSWSGSFSTESAEECQEDASENKEDYYKNVKMCLTNSCSTYICKFTVKDNDCATFEWSRTFGDKNIEQVYGAVDLQKDTITENKNELTDFLLRKTHLQKKDIEESKGTIDNLKLDVEKLKAELSKLADSQTSLEDSLYGKFVTLLNTKKSRIQALEDYLQKYEN